MNESLLAGGEARVQVDEDDALWNELKEQPSIEGSSSFAASSRDDSPSNRPFLTAVGVSPGRSIDPTRPGGAFGSNNNSNHTNKSSGNAPASLPSLRTHAHLPAISTLFHEFADSTKSFLNSKQQQQPPPPRHAQGQEEEDDTQRFRVYNGSLPDSFGYIHNVDAFLINLYNYFFHKGFWCIVAVELVGLITGFFTVALTSFLLGCVDWAALATCHQSKEGCKGDLAKYFVCSPLAKSKSLSWAPSWSSPAVSSSTSSSSSYSALNTLTVASSRGRSVWHVLVTFYFLAFCIYWFSRLVQAIQTIREARAMQAFYLEKLLIDNREVQTVIWDEVVQRVLGLLNGPVSPQLQQQQQQQTINMAGTHPHIPFQQQEQPRRNFSSYRLQIENPSTLRTPHDFARRIMRRENYMIAFMNHSLLQDVKSLGLPDGTIWPSWLHFASPQHLMMSRNMECNLNLCVMDYLFDDRNHRISASLLSQEKVLQKRFVIAGVLNLILMPFLLVYRIFRFLFESAQEWHVNRVQYFGTRRWSAFALWKFREYNELPHVFEARISRSYESANKYMELFPSGPIAIVASGVSFCCSSLMGVMFIIGLLEESLVISLYGRPLLWYGAVFGGIFTVSRWFATSSSNVSSSYSLCTWVTGNECEEAMARVSSEIHFFPREWQNKCHTFAVYDAFVALFPYKVVLFLQECLSVILAPYLLCVVLPKRSRDLLLFVRTHTIDLPQMGSVCRFAEFDFKKYQKDPKMESSFVNFKQNHPKWIGSAEGEALVEQLGRLRVEEMEKSMRMGDTMYASASGGPMPLSLSQQLMQSHAIHTALAGSISSPYSSALLPVQENEFYWLEKLHRRSAVGAVPSSEEELEEVKEQEDHAFQPPLGSMGNNSPGANSMAHR